MNSSATAAAGPDELAYVPAHAAARRPISAMRIACSPNLDVLPMDHAWQK